MKTILKRTTSRTIRSVVLGASLLLGAPAFASWYQLNLPLVTQEHSNWCWAGSSKAILDYYSASSSQCGIVNWSFGINYACGNTTFSWNSYANQPNSLYGTNGSIQSILSAWGGLSSTPYNYASSWNSVVWDINNWRPFVIRYGWTGGGGHFMVGYGWETYNGTNYVYIMNPWPGEGRESVAYSYAVSASDHQWTHTLRLNQ